MTSTTLARPRTGCPQSAPRPRPRSRIVALHMTAAALLAALWLAVGPVSGPYRNHVAELVGLEAVWLMASSVLVLTRSPRVERVTGGVGAGLWWHRVAGALGLALGLVHPRLFVPVVGPGHSVVAGLLNPLTLVGVVLLVWAAFLTPTSRAARWRGPVGWLARRGYDRWRSVHALLAVFVVATMAHGVLDSRSLLQEPLLLAAYAAVCAAGLYALAERLVLARREDRRVGASVVSVRRFDRAVVLRMLPDRPVVHAAGQFVELSVPAAKEQPHPFTIVSTPGDPMVEIAVQAAGDGTARIVDDLAAGDRVRLGAVRGTPDRPASSGRELWVASGIGVTPFVARLRSRSRADVTTPVDLVWTRRGFDDAPYVDELRRAAAELPWFTLHLRDTSREVRLTADDVLAIARADPGDLTVHGCGAPSVVGALVSGLAARGVPRARITTEAFGFR